MPSERSHEGTHNAGAQAPWMLLILSQGVGAAHLQNEALKETGSPFETVS